MRAKARALGYSLSHKGLQRVERGKYSKSQVVREGFTVYFWKAAWRLCLHHANRTDHGVELLFNRNHQ